MILITVRWIDKNSKEFEKDFEADSIRFSSVFLRIKLTNGKHKNMPMKNIKRCIIYPEICEDTEISQ